MTRHTPTRHIFLTGATGSMGLAATRHLIAQGHRVTGVTRSRQGADALTALGATPVEVDLFDPHALTEAMRGVDIVAHLATSIPAGLSAIRRSAWRTNDRLRREGTAALITAAENVGARRFIFESLGFAYADHGEQWIDESVPLAPPSHSMHTTVEAEEQLAAFQERGGEAVSLRFGRLYGPGRASNDFIAALRQRALPIIGRGDNYVPSIHVDDVGSSVAAAVDVAPGAYNIVDEPLAQEVLMKHAAACLGAPAPRRLPYTIARLMLGQIAKVAASSQRVSNRRFRDATGWQPRFPTALEGWRDVAREVGSVSETEPGIEAQAA